MAKSVSSERGQLNITSVRGDTLSLGTALTPGIVLRFEDGGTPRDLSGYTAKLQVRKTKATRNAILLFTDADGTIDMSDAANGRLKLIHSAAQMTVKAFKDYYYDLQLTAPSGQVETQLWGFWTNLQDITEA